MPIKREKITSAPYVLLFVHGIFGSYRHFRFLNDLLPSEMDYRFLELKGHEGSAQLFPKATMADWSTEVRNSVQELSGKGKKILFVAHSMGCLFAILNAIENPAIEGLFLLNPPIAWTFKLKNVIPYLQVIFDTPKKSPMAKQMRSASDLLFTKNLFAYVSFTPNLYRLARLIGQTKRALPELKTPAVCFLSDHDELVQKRSKKILRKYPICHVIDIDESGHFGYAKTDQEKIRNEFRIFVTR